MPEELHTKREKQKTEDRFTRKESRLYTNFDLLATKDSKRGNKIVFMIIIALFLMLGAYLVSFYI
jgi:hypothetical protein